ncbi:hypothetical protein GT755_14115 [Herbidospora sp. NEAU-GS84]|uniref:Uncharacterized protein n=1 Tax=Herbidospora solisilvae TaxID=2696284 RepID=A0A7C9J3I6_9ACTN|nr:phospholipase A2 [Herbidospora solisilvae]NAS22820.1 hypothetical protein [Herbidospora solisilvae]
MTRSTHGLARAATILAVVRLLAGGPGVASAGAADDPVEETDRLLFEVSLGDFAEQADQERMGLDDCSFAEGQEGFDFGEACWRHDLGYRNYRSQGRLTTAARERIDGRLLTDINGICARYRGREAFRAVVCRGEGRVLHGLVRGVGRVYPAASVITPAGRVVRLYAAAQEPFAVGWISGAALGDTVWADRSWNSGVTWIQLGLTKVEPFLTTAVTPPMWDRHQSLRACGQARGGPVACTRWVTV